jgi:hypothetical protein
MQIKLVYDIVGPSGPFPNGFNYNYINDAWNNNFLVDHIFIENFNKNYTHLSVYDCNLNLSTQGVTKIHISDVKTNDTDNLVYYNGSPDNFFLYTIHPFGDINTSLGNNLNYHQNTNSFEFISARVKKYIQKYNNFYLTLDYSSEGDIKSEIFDNLHKICKEINITPSKVIIITSAMNTRDLYKKYLDLNPEENEFYTAYYPWPFLPKRGELNTYFNNSEEFTFNGYNNKISFMSENDFKKSLKREKKCLVFNRRVAPHRVAILSLLQSDKLLNYVDYSIDLSMWNHGDLALEMSNGTDYDKNPYIADKIYKSKMINGVFDLKKINKCVIDYNDIENVWGFGFEHKEPYLKTYFSVITETIFYEHGHYISEKTFKGIQHLHPFVIVGKPGILKYLQSKGFKTFNEFWDESYDTIHDNSDRMIKVYELIKSLILKSDDDWIELNKKLLPILKHNREHLLSFDEEFVNSTYINNLNNLLQHEPNQENYFLF